jgi:hypothetical protein
MRSTKPEQLDFGLGRNQNSILTILIDPISRYGFFSGKRLLILTNENPRMLSVKYWATNDKRTPFVG